MNRRSEPAGALVTRAQQGDVLAQQELWRLHRRWVAAIVIAHRPRSVDVEDLMQDVAVKLISKLDTLRDVEAFRPWLRQIVINICRGAARGLHPTLRLAQTERADDDATDGRFAAPAESGDASAESTLETLDAAGRLLRQAMTLPTEYREPLMLRCVRSLSYQQISEILDLPITTIETRLARARRMLREEIGEQVALEGTC